MELLEAPGLAPMLFQGTRRPGLLASVLGAGLVPQPLGPTTAPSASTHALCSLPSTRLAELPTNRLSISLADWQSARRQC